MSLIEITDLYKIYGEGLESEVRALDGVSLSIARGEFCAIVGASGSGKSTLMNILGCLDLPTYGTYHLDGELVSELSDGKLARIRNRMIGFIFQGFNLLGDLTALENVELPLVYQGVHGKRRRQMAESALSRVGLQERMHHKPSEMSGGQQQRVAIARAIATAPPIIMADEPTGNLDSRTGSHVMEVLSTLHAEGTTILLITHDTQVAETAARRIHILDGRIIRDDRAPRGQRMSAAAGPAGSAGSAGPTAVFPCGPAGPAAVFPCGPAGPAAVFPCGETGEAAVFPCGPAGPAAVSPCEPAGPAAVSPCGETGEAGPVAVIPGTSVGEEASI